MHEVARGIARVQLPDRQDLQSNLGLTATGTNLALGTFALLLLLLQLQLDPLVLLILVQQLRPELPDLRFYVRVPASSLGFQKTRLGCGVLVPGCLLT